MCGRYILTSPLDAVRHLFKVMSGLNLAPRYNIAPTQAVPVVFKDDAGNHAMVPMRWGLVPSWFKDIPKERPQINARAESVREKPMFRAAYRRRRCIVPANGFYEWKSVDKGVKQPIFIGLEGQKLFGFAGIWEMWQGQDGGSALQSVAFLTRPAYPSLESVHHRMPVILNEKCHSLWLDTEADPMDAAILADEVAFRTYPVSNRVNHVAEDAPSLIEQAEPDAGLSPAVVFKHVKSDKQEQLSLF